ncbi:DUF937 domain-containing protein [Homoserinibacter gongjuensis]|uniref:DUF937 domain-containing protein n=1 Tax=Homoserinibacter gongjuensis TaxID=1162968 RepID=A0ABQ6K028_9MICO|nr:DUF937 domain-containing protein [Homoserinibacter gongjuensis]GMA92885.1 hypothetical protein GCM10025869_34140 [Homoserinibacter gongjuensis]
MAQYDDLLAQIPIGDIAKQLGIDEDVAEDAVKQVLPGLVGGLKANADEGGQASLERALQKHQGAKLRGVSDVDTADGEKIVKHVFGDKEDAVVSTLAGSSAKSEVTDVIIKKVLPIVAPIVLAWLANKFLGGSSESSSKGSSGGGLGDLLGGLLGGGGSSKSSNSGGPDLGDLLGGLGGLLGGGTK